MELYVTIFWAVITVLLIVTEAITPQLVTVWFSLGSLSALLTSIITDKIWLQATVFIIVSVLSLFFTRPIVKKHINTKKIATNSDRLIGKTGIVKEKIDNNNAVGLVTVDGSLWSAKSKDGTSIDQGSEVTVEKIEGVKLVVTLK